MWSKPPGPNRLIFIAGQLGLDMENKLVGAPGDFRAQANQAVENLKLALADAGATIRDVVKINNYLVDMSHIADLPRSARSPFQYVAPPASTTVAISQLARPGALFEIEAIAVLPAKVAKSVKAAKPAVRRSSKVKAADENEGDQDKHRQQNGARPEHIAEEARHFHAALVGDRRDHEVGCVADIAQRTHVNRPHGNGGEGGGKRTH